MPVLPTLARVRELLDYDPLSGRFTWRVAKSHRNPGDAAGCLDKGLGYIRLSIDGQHHWAHRIAWFYVTGEWPPADVDHLDSDRANNRFANLRLATRAENLQNQTAPTPRSKTGVRGVQWDEERQQYRVEISVHNRNKFIGRFAGFEDACAARQAARRQYHPGAIL